MKRFLVQVAVFFALVAVIDVCCGPAFEYLRSHAETGETVKEHYIAERCEDDVLILGSSRAANHYVSLILEDSLGMSCYNAGQTGCGIVPAYARYKMVAGRHLPELVIYEVTPEYDYLVADDYSKYYGGIRPYADKASVKELFKAFSDKYEQLKLLSRMYGNNSCLIRYVKDQRKGMDTKGFEFLYETLQSIPEKPAEEEPLRVDSLKLHYFEKLVETVLADHVRLVFAVSPVVAPMSENERSAFEPAFRLARAHAVPVLDFSSDERFLGKLDLFQNEKHLNYIGAELFTRHFIAELRSCLHLE